MSWACSPARLSALASLSAFLEGVFLIICRLDSSTRVNRSMFAAALSNSSTALWISLTANASLTRGRTSANPLETRFAAMISSMLSDDPCVR